MKKFISVFLAVSLILCSFSFVFADFTSSDSTNLYNIYQRVNSLYTIINNTMPTFNQISTVNSNLSDIYSRLGTINTTLGTLSTISNTLTTISGKLTSGNYSIASLTSSILDWMRPIYNSIQAIPVDLSTIIGALGYYDSNNTYHPYLNDINNYFATGTWGSGWWDSNKRITMLVYRSADALTANYNLQLGRSFPQDLMQFMVISSNNTLQFLQRITGNYNATQTLTDPSDLSTSTFTATSLSDGLFKYLQAIQAPTARLSYVLASDERIEAQEAAAANEQAVVDNFIDSNGSGAASTSDFDSIADFSSGYKSTFASDASPTGIFDIFNSNNMGWFSQETANQLDTTNSNNRAKSDNTFNTPLLDQQINSIYEQLGVKQP